MPKKNAINPKHLLYIILATGILVVLAMGPILRAHNIKQRNTCLENQDKIYGARDQWALDNHANPNAKPTIRDLIQGGYLKETPKCPSGGTYFMSTMDEYPNCSLSSNQKYRHQGHYGAP